MTLSSGVLAVVSTSAEAPLELSRVFPREFVFDLAVLKHGTQDRLAREEPVAAAFPV